MIISYIRFEYQVVKQIKICFEEESSSHSHFNTLSIKWNIIEKRLIHPKNPHFYEFLCRTFYKSVFPYAK